MKRYIGCLLTVILLCLVSGCGETSKDTTVYAMDTVMTLRAFGKDAETALKEAEQDLYKLEGLLSKTREGSDISKLNQDESAEVSEVTVQLLQEAGKYQKVTDGCFDITIAPLMKAWGFSEEEFHIPPEEEIRECLSVVDGSQIVIQGQQVTIDKGQMVDLGGIAKGYASDRVEAIFRSRGISSAVVSLGGNALVMGEKQGGKAWNVGVQDPLDTQNRACVMQLKDAYAITSGGYQRYFEENGVRYHHILNPRTGCPSDGDLLSVTIVAPVNGTTELTCGNGTMCDALSTALFVMGSDQAISFWRTSGLDFELILITRDQKVLVSEGLKTKITEKNEAKYSYEIIAKTETNPG